MVARVITRWTLLIVMTTALLLPPTGAARAAGVSYTVTVRSAFLRAAPSFSATPRHSVFAGQTYTVLGRSADAAWVLLDFAGAEPGTTWIAAAWGQLSGSLEAVAVSTLVGADPPPAEATGAAPVAAAGPVYYTVTATSLFARAGPSTSTARVASLFKGERWLAIARSADGAWLQLKLPGVAAWVPAGAGSVTGALMGLPVAGAAPAATAAVPSVAAPPLTISAAARTIYERGLALGNNPHAFSKVGDCNSSTPYFLASFDKGEYRLGEAYAYLQPVIDNFAGSFNRDGAVARDGLNTASVFDSIWSPPALCERGESPLACEVRVQRPSMAIISLGTNGSWQTDAEYETNMRRIIDFLIERGVLPILSTKADNLEGDGRFNRVVIKLAGEYELPLWDYATVAWALPNGGLADAYHLTWGQAYYDTARLPLTGWQARNLTALQALDAVWRGVQ
jgi:hypothetical protein